MRTVTPEQLAQAGRPRNDLVGEVQAASAGPEGSGRDRSGRDGSGGDAADACPGAAFTQESGPFAEYERTLSRPDPATGAVTETITYRLVVPWFRWLFALPIRFAMRRRTGDDGRQPPWAPPDRLTSADVLILGLLAAASMSAAFVNTLFTQTVNFAADDFGISEGSQGIAGVIVRCGIVFALPFAIAADRIGRRRVIVTLAWIAPLCAAAGALAPNFWVLTASQAIGRPLGIALDLLIAVVAAESMPRNSRAYAVSVLAMASGLGAGVAVMALPLADLSAGSWRLVYVVALVWLLVALDLARRLPETARFERHQRRRALTTGHTTDRAAIARHRRRFLLLGSVVFFANVFVAPASYFQNRYLDDVRGYNALGITLFTLCTATPASVGFVIGGKLADTRGRRRILAVALPAATAMLVVSFFVAGPLMWASAFVGGMLGGIAYPAFAVYRTELFPTGSRGRIGGFVTTLALVGGSIGLLVAGAMLDAGWSYGTTMLILAVGEVIAATIVFLTYPETAHRDLDDLNPEDRAPDDEPVFDRPVRH